MSNKFQLGWNKIFDELSINENIEHDGFFDLSASQIKQISGREPRLMTKVDFRQSLPTIMRDNGLSILAIKNGLYRIAKTDPFIDIPSIYNKEQVIALPVGYISIDPFDITSESMAMDVAKISGMMDMVFGEKSELTIRGRLRKGANFEFLLQKTMYNVDGVQIEVDGGYEGFTRLNLLEAKIGGISNINIRQIIYPELAWKNIIGDQKQIYSYVFSYENPFFRFIPVVFSEGKWKTDVINEKVFIFQEEQHYDLFSISISDIELLNYSTPFPQADNFEKVLIMLQIINKYEIGISKTELLNEMESYDLHTLRQIDYYANCLKMLRFISIDNGYIEVTNLGKKILQLKVKNQAFEIGKRIFSDSIFHKSLHQGIDKLSKKEFEKKWGELADSTFYRRKQTIKSWIGWFQDIFKSQ